MRNILVWALVGILLCAFTRLVLGQETGWSFEEKDGIVCMEAEHFSSRHLYRAVHATRASQGLVMVADENESASPTLTCKFTISNGGKWYVHVRYYAMHHKNNGLHIDIDGQGLRSGGTDVIFLEKRYGWCWQMKWQSDAGGRIATDLSPGQHTVTIRRRERGRNYVDKILLSKDSTCPGKLELGPEETVKTQGSGKQDIPSYTLHGEDDFLQCSGFTRYPGDGTAAPFLYVSSGDKGSAWAAFPGYSGTYDAYLDAAADKGGSSDYKVYLRGYLVGEHHVAQHTGDGTFNYESVCTKIIKNVRIARNDEVKIEGTVHASSHAPWWRVFFWGVDVDTTDTTGIAPTGPSHLIAIPSIKSISLVWKDNSSNESKFQIERSSDSLSWRLIAAVAENVASYRDTSVLGADKYHYRVKAVGSAGSSLWSNIASATMSTAVGHEADKRSSDRTTILAVNGVSQRQASFLIRVGKPGDLTLRVYDLVGKKVWQCNASLSRSGLHNITWNFNEFGHAGIPGGIYFLYSKQGKGERARRAFVLVR